MRFDSTHSGKALTPPSPWLRFLFLVALLAAPSVHALRRVLLMQTGFRPDQGAIPVNEDGPQSRQFGEYHRVAGRIPEGKAIRPRFPPGSGAVPKDEFLLLEAQVGRETSTGVQACAVARVMSYRVACMSLTSALALGLAQTYCSDKCGPTAASPCISITGRQRAACFDQTATELAGVFPVVVLATRAMELSRDVLFYFSGLPVVPHLKRPGLLPGALADHLTSFGGQFSGACRRSSLRWLENGATASGFARADSSPGSG